MRISDWSSDVCSSDLHGAAVRRSEQRVSLQRLRDVDVATPLDFLGILDHRRLQRIEARALDTRTGDDDVFPGGFCADVRLRAVRSEEHTSELQSLMRISYAVFCLQQ